MALESRSPQINSDNSIRKVEIEDFPWILALAATKFIDLNKEDSAKFLYYATQKSNFLVIRTDHAFGCALFEPWPFNTSILNAHEIFLVSDGTQGWDTYNIAKEMVKWARDNKCDMLQFDPKSELGPVMKRLGFAQEQPSYRLNLKQRH